MARRRMAFGRAIQRSSWVGGTDSYPLDPRSLRQLFARFSEYAAQSVRALPAFCFGVGVRWCAQTTSATLRDATAARDSHLDRCRAFESHALSEIILLKPDV